MDNDIRLKDAKSSLKTVAIYSLYCFENHFGHLWGHEKLESELTDSEKKMRSQWKICRKEILDQEGCQSRKLQRMCGVKRDVITFTVEGDIDGNR